MLSAGPSVECVAAVAPGPWQPLSSFPRLATADTGGAAWSPGPAPAQ